MRRDVMVMPWQAPHAGKQCDVRQMSRLSIRAIEALTPRSQAYIVFDERGGKFGVRVMPSGKKSYLFQYRAKGRTPPEVDPVFGTGGLIGKRSAP